MTHPYATLPDWHFWSRSVSGIWPHEVDPVVGTNFMIAHGDPVATMGSCFAQHISRHLARRGLNYFVPEDGGEGLSEADRTRRGFGVFSARYGNVYTPKQALQLLLRAYGEWDSRESAWQRGSAWVDPFRPLVEPDGFATVQEMELDRVTHLAHVRRVFEESRFLIFTLGLTESWMSRSDGSVFPVVPGNGVGHFDSSAYFFHNPGVAELMDDLAGFIDRVKEVNPSIEVVLTVSPVPLIATFSSQHVLPATVYSKSVLRVAAHELSSQRRYVHYFPSYEIITGQASGNRYFEPDLRSVTQAGVEHVMRVFNSHHIELGQPSSQVDESQRRIEREEVSQVICDEESLDPLNQ